MSMPPRRERQTDQRQALLAEMFTAAQLAQGGITSQQIAQATARLSENARDPEGGRGDPPPPGRVGQAVGPLPPARRAGRGAAPGRDAATKRRRRRSRQADHRRAGGAGRCRRGAAGGVAQLRPARAAGGAGQGRVRRAASGRGVRRASRSATTDGWVFLLRDGSITVSRIDGGLRQIAELVRRVRAGIELTAERPADLRHRRRADTVPADARRRGRLARRREGAGRGAGRPAAVAAVRGAADRPGGRRRSWPTRRGWCASSPWRTCRRRPTSSRCARSPQARARRARGSASATSIR